MTDTLTITLPTHVRIRLEKIASDRGVALEDLISLFAAQHAEDHEATMAFFRERAARAKPGAFDRVFGLARPGGEAPLKGDEIL